MSKSNRDLYEERLKKKKVREEASRSKKELPVNPTPKGQTNDRKNIKAEKKISLSFGGQKQEKKEVSQPVVQKATPEKKPAPKMVSEKETLVTPWVQKEPVARETVSPKKMPPMDIPVRGKVPPKKEAPKRVNAEVKIEPKEVTVKPKAVVAKPKEAPVKPQEVLQKQNKTVLTPQNPDKKKSAITAKKKILFGADKKEVPEKRFDSSHQREMQKETPKTVSTSKEKLQPKKGITSAASKSKPPKRVLKPSKKPLIAVAILVFVVLCGYGVWNYTPISNMFSAKDEVVEAPVLYCANFEIGSTAVKKVTDIDTSTVELENMPLYLKNTYMIPVNCLNEIFDLSVTISGDGNRAAITDEETRMTIENDNLEGSVNDLAQNLSGIPFLNEGELYVSVNDIATVFGYEISEDSTINSISLIRPGMVLDTPNVWFSTDKTVYAPGEKVEYALINGKNNHSIVEYRWENKQSRFFTQGDYTITLQGKDIFGQWSEVAERTIEVSGPPYVGASKTPVLMYHYFTENQSEIEEGGDFYGNGAIMWIGQFRQQMEYLKTNGYQTMFISDFQSYVDCGVLPPEKTVVLIFDDGYQNNYSLAYPILKELGLKGNIAPVLNSSLNNVVLEEDKGRLRALTFDEMKEMMDSNTIEIGSHTYNGHVYYEPYSGEEGFFFVNPAYNAEKGARETKAEYQDRVTNDLIISRNVLSEQLGEENPFFIYPYGRKTDFLENTLKNLGYSSGFVITDKYATPGVGVYEIPRFNINTNTTMEEYAKIVSCEK